MTQPSPPYSPEVRERAVRMVFDHRGEHGEILRKARAYFAQAELDRPFKRRSPSSTTIGPSTGSSFESLRMRPICRALPIAPSTYHAYAARRADPEKLPARARSDAALMAEVRRVFEENVHVYGVRKVWRQLGREGRMTAR